MSFLADISLVSLRAEEDLLKIDASSWLVLSARYAGMLDLFGVMSYASLL